RTAAAPAQTPPHPNSDHSGCGPGRDGSPWPAPAVRRFARTGGEWVLRQLVPEAFVWRVSRMGEATAQQIVEGRCRRILVRRRPGAVEIGYLFGRHELGGPPASPRKRQPAERRLLVGSRQPEVGQFDLLALAR